MQVTNKVTISAMPPKINITIVLPIAAIKFAIPFRFSWTLGVVLDFADERKMAGEIKINKRIAKTEL